MKLSNTLMINESLLPSSKKAFTLAEVLITLSILGVVAALTIPNLVNRNSDIAAQVKLKKAISNYEDVAAIYMVENETTNLGVTGAAADSFMGGEGCPLAANYFKIVSRSGCTFTTADGVYWVLDPGSGFAYVADSDKSPRYGVTMWALNGQVNGVGQTDGTSNVPSSLFIPESTAAPLHGVYAAGGTHSFLNLKQSDMNNGNNNALISGQTNGSLSSNPASLSPGSITDTPGLGNN